MEQISVKDHLKNYGVNIIYRNWCHMKVSQRSSSSDVSSSSPPPSPSPSEAKTDSSKQAKPPESTGTTSTFKESAFQQSPMDLTKAYSDSSAGESDFSYHNPMFSGGAASASTTQSTGDPGAARPSLTAALAQAGAPSIGDAGLHTNDFADFSSKEALQQLSQRPFARVELPGVNISDPTASGVLVRQDDGSIGTKSKFALVADRSGSAEQAKSDITRGIEHYAKEAGISSPQAFASAVMTTRELMSTKEVTADKYWQMNEGLQDMVKASLSAPSGSQETYQREHMMSLADGDGLAGGMAQGIDSGMSPEDIKQFKQIESMYDKFSLIKDDSRLKTEMDDRNMSMGEKAAHTLKEKTTTAKGQASLMPGVKVGVKVAEGVTAHNRAAEMASVRQSGVVDHPGADASMSTLHKHQKQEEFTSMFGATLSAATSFIPGVGDAITAPADLLIDGVADQVAGHFTDEATESASDKAANIGTKKGVNAAAKHGHEKLALSPEKLAKQLRIDPGNSKTSLADHKTAQALMAYLTPGADKQRLESGDTRESDTELARLLLRNEMFGLSGDAQVDPVSSREAQALRQHFDAFAKSEDDDGRPLLDPQEFADSLQQGAMDPLSMAAGIDIGAQSVPNKKSHEFFENFRGE